MASRQWDWRAAGARRYGDAFRYCEDCAAWTGHEMQDDGSYACLLPERHVEAAE